MVFGAPPIPGLGVAGGFKIMVEDRGGLGLPTLQEQTDTLDPESCKARPALAGVTTSSAPTRRSSSWTSTGPRSRPSASRSTTSIQTLKMYLGSLYVNSFNEFGRHWQVTVQADGNSAPRSEDINLFQVRNNRGQMVPLGTLVHDPRDRAAPSRHALQPVHRRADHRQPAARRQLRRGHRRDRASWPARRCRAP